MRTIDVTIEEMRVPATVDGPGWGEFVEYAAVRNAVESHTMGTDLLTMPVREMWSEYRDNPHRVRRHFAARSRGAIVGRGMVTLRPHLPDDGAYLMVDVLPSHRGRGIGTALLHTVEGLAEDAAAPVLKVAVPHSVRAGGARVASPTGFGDVAAADPGVRFLTSQAYALEQINRVSLLDPSAVPDRLEASTPPPPDYRVRTWVGPTPDEWADGVAVLRTRMSTDAPSGGLVTSADPWDAPRIREHDERITTSGRTMLTAAVEHVPSGTLVGFTELLCSGAAPVAVQEDTLVLREHRGRRLGTVLKLATTDLLRRHVPEAEAIVTWNAEENRPMLDVNEAMGFRAIGYEGLWQKRR